MGRVQRENKKSLPAQLGNDKEKDIVQATEKQLIKHMRFIIKSVLESNQICSLEGLKRTLERSDWAGLAFYQYYKTLSTYLKNTLNKHYFNIDEKQTDVMDNMYKLKQIFPNLNLTLTSDDLSNKHKITREILASDWRVSPITIDRLLKTAKQQAKLLYDCFCPPGQTFEEFLLADDLPQLPIDEEFLRRVLQYGERKKLEWQLKRSRTSDTFKREYLRGARDGASQSMRSIELLKECLKKTDNRKLKEKAIKYFFTMHSRLLKKQEAKLNSLKSR